VWDIEFLDLAGRGKSIAPTPVGFDVSVQHNVATTMALALHADDPAAALPIPGSTLVQAWRTGADGVKRVRFAGIVWGVEEQLGAGERAVNVVAVCPWAILDRRYTTAAYAATDQGAIIKDLVDDANTDRNTYIRTDADLVEATITRDRSWSDNRTPVSDAILSFTELLDSVDIYLSPIEYANGKIAELYVVERRGSVDPVAVFGVGVGTVDNCLTIARSRSMEGVGTRVVATGAGGLTVTVNDATQQSALGLLVEDRSFGSVVMSSTLTAHAQEVLDHVKRADVAVAATPNYNAPMLWDDFDIGDVVDVQAAYQSVAFIERARVFAASVTVDEAGNEYLASVELGDTTTLAAPEEVEVPDLPEPE
jgi:hypothetical protein